MVKAFTVLVVLGLIIITSGCSSGGSPNYTSPTPCLPPPSAVPPATLASPASGATGVSIDIGQITIALDQMPLRSTLTLTTASGAVLTAGTLSAGSLTGTYAAPIPQLAAETTYAVTLKAAYGTLVCNPGDTQQLGSFTTAAIQPLRLTFSAAGQSGSYQALLTAPGSIVITPAGVRPYTASAQGTCATLDRATSPSTFVASANFGVCTVTVQDAAGRARAILLQVESGPPRFFLTVDPGNLVQTSGDLPLRIGASVVVTVDELLAGSSSNAPYGIQIIGSCATATGVGATPAGSLSATISGTSPGQCVVVFSDSRGTTTAWNLSVG